MSGFRAYFDFSLTRRPEDFSEGDVIELSQDESRHLCGSLRACPGDAADAFDLNGNVWRCRIRESSPKRAELELLQKLKIESPRSKIYAAQCLPKGKVFDDILRQSVEVGASGIIPTISDYSQVRFDAHDAERKSAKWRTHIVEAIKQSANFSAYTVSEPITFRKFISESAENFNLKIVSSLQSDAKPIIEVLNGIKERPKNICILTGPEGDMSPNEYSLAAEAGFLPVKIGQNVMKCDTASLTAMAICNAYYNLD